MKNKLFRIITVSFLILICAGCSQKSEIIDISELHDKIADEGSFSDVLSPITPDIAQALYGYESEDVIDCKVSCSTGATTEEIAVFECADENAADRVFDAAKKRIQTQKTAYESYAPLEIPKLDNAVVKKTGKCVTYVVSNDSDKVMELIK